MRLLALDQASRTSGYAIFEDDKLIKYGSFTFTDEDFGKRLVKIINKVAELIQEYKIDEIAIEDIQLQGKDIQNVKVYRALAEVRGVLEEYFTRNKIKYQIISSNTWKSELNIKGASREVQKKNAQKYVVENYGLKVSEDISDAICIGTSITKQKNSAFIWD